MLKGRKGPGMPQGWCPLGSLLASLSSWGLGKRRLSFKLSEPFPGFFWGLCLCFPPVQSLSPRFPKASFLPLYGHHADVGFHCTCLIAVLCHLASTVYVLIRGIPLTVPHHHLQSSRTCPLLFWFAPSSFVNN